METHDSALEKSAASCAPRLEELLQQVIQHGGFSLKFAIRNSAAPGNDAEAPELVVDFSGPDADLLLEKNGALLDALEYVLLRAVRPDEGPFGKIIFDCKDWRRVRAEELHLTAQVAAEQVVEMGNRLELNPMSARERRIVHLALKDHPRVRTVSEGFGPERRVVVIPAPPAPSR